MEQKKKNVPFIIMIVVYVVTVVSLVVAGFIFRGKYEKRYDEIEEKYKAENQKYDDTYSKYISLVNEHSQLETDYGQLEESYDELEEKYNEIETDYSELQEDTEPTYEQPEDLSGYDDTITYDDLARTPDEYEGKAVKLKGEVLQVMEMEEETDLRIAVNGNYDNVVFVGYSKNAVSERILEGDNVTIYGNSVGLYTYQSTMGGDITIPALWVDAIERN